MCEKNNNSGNMNRSKMVVFKKRELEYRICLNGQEMKSIYMLKYLGSTFSKNGAMELLKYRQISLALRVMKERCEPSDVMGLIRSS